MVNRIDKSMLGEYYLISLDNVTFDNASDEYLLKGQKEARMLVVGFSFDKKSAYGTVEFKAHYISIQVPIKDIKKYSEDQVNNIS